MVIGSDLSLIQRKHELPNLEFVQHDVELDEWQFGAPFDYIHMRYIVTCFDNTKAVFQNAYDNMNAGGWVEFFDADMDLKSPDGSFQGTAIERWGKLLLQGGQKRGRDLLRPRHFAEWCRDIGFEDVHEEIVPLPNNGWPEDPKMRAIGELYTANLIGLVDSFTKFLTLAGLSRTEAVELETQAKKDIQNPDIHFVVST
ncbi:hypothetical protein V2A60_004319 [Cordyceps javanica]